MPADAGSEASTTPVDVIGGLFPAWMSVCSTSWVGQHIGSPGPWMVMFTAIRFHDGHVLDQNAVPGQRGRQVSRHPSNFMDNMQAVETAAAATGGDQNDGCRRNSVELLEGDVLGEREDAL